MGSEKEEHYFRSSIEDIIRRYEKRSEISFSHFLSEQELSSAISVMRCRCAFAVWGGTEFSVRKIIAAGPAEKEDFPITCLTVSNSAASAPFSHRDILGSLMGLGIERDVLGDIMIDDGGHRAFVFCLSSMAEYIRTNLTSVSRDSCSVFYADPSDTEGLIQKFTELKISVSSERLDCFVAALAGVSREKAKEMFMQNLIFLNSRAEKNPEKTISENDIISIRGCGRFIVDSYLKQSRKGKLQYQIKKFS